MKPNHFSWVRVSVLVLVITCALVVHSPGAEAQDLTDDELQRFETFVTEGANALRVDDHAMAVRAFRSAMEIHEHPRLLMEVASSLAALDECEEARQTLERLLSRENLDETIREEGRARREDLQNCNDVEVRAETEIAATELQEEDDKEESELSFADPSRMEQENKDNPSLPASIDRPPNWRPWTIGGVFVVGTGLIAGGIAMDLDAANRAESLRIARASGDEASLQQWSEYNAGMRNATLALYGSGATLVLAGGALLIWHFVDRPVSAELTATSAHLRFHW